MRAGNFNLRVTSETATASVGDTTAPSANAAASGMEGMSQCTTYPTTNVVANTRPNASIKIE